MTPGLRAPYRPGRDRRAVGHRAPLPAGGSSRSQGWSDRGRHHVLVAGGGIAGIAAACALAERGVAVTLVERHDRLGGRVRSWPVTLADGSPETMSRGFHAFFRQYYNLRALLRRADPQLQSLRFVPDYPLQLAGAHTDTFAGVPRTPPWNLAAFVAKSPSFTVDALRRVDVEQALGLLDVSFPATFEAFDGVSAAQLLDRLRFPPGARHLALEVFARSFFADPREFSAGELLAMFHMYFVGSAEGLLFDVPSDDYDTVLWAPLGRYLERLGVRIRYDAHVTQVSAPPGEGPVSVTLDDGHAPAEVDAVVLATDPRSLRDLVATSPRLGDADWRDRVADVRSAPPFAVWRLWTQTPAAADRPPFLGTSGFGPVDNVSLVERLEAHAADWARRSGGSVVEVHAYAVPPGSDEAELRGRMRAELDRIYPELAGTNVVDDRWLLEQDCALVSTGPWRRRPTVGTPDPRVALAGDAIRCDYPVALMERAATTGFLAANQLLDGWGLAGHDVWTVPLGSRFGAVPGRLRRVLQRVGGRGSVRG